MSKPHLSTASFPKLSQSRPSTGTVTGPSLDTHHGVTIHGRGGKVWAGRITRQIQGDTWEAQVSRTNTILEEERGQEAVSVTVTNPGGETSDPVPANSDIIP